jgi:hypothetical protein
MRRQADGQERFGTLPQNSDRALAVHKRARIPVNALMACIPWCFWPTRAPDKCNWDKKRWQTVSGMFSTAAIAYNLPKVKAVL